MIKVSSLFNVNGSIGQSAYGATDFPAVLDMLKHMDYLGIDRSLVWHLGARDMNPDYGNRRLLKEIAEAGAEKRILPAFIVTPACYYGNGVLSYLKECFSKKQVRAIRLTPEMSRFPIRRIERVLSELAEFKPLVLWDYSALDNEQKFIDLEKLADKFPQINFTVTQVMWPAFGGVLDLMWRCPNVYIDISWLHVRSGIELLCKDFGAKRVLFGIGFKAHYGAAIAELAFARISDAERELIAHGNVEQLLGLSGLEKKLTEEFPDKLEKPLWDKFKKGESLNEIKIIDAHGHDQLPSFGLFFPETSLEENVGVLVGQTKRFEINQTILSSGAALFGDGVEGNRETEKAFTKYENLFKGYLGFNPRFSADLVPLFDDFFSRDFYVGFKLLSSYWKIPLPDPSYNPVWKYADKNHLPILMHTWNNQYNSPAMLTEIVKEYPHALFLLGHSGGGTPGRLEAIELVKNNDNVYLEFCGSFTTPELFESAIAQVGIKKVLYGSDTVMHSVAWELGRFLSLPVNDDELRPALAQNMECILKKRI
ncbi:MAG: amidohydrolase family protein [Spirochaetales bacterium]|nr:amidohydrolase family protein [Spirochaetales bacterium]